MPGTPSVETDRGLELGNAGCVLASGALQHAFDGTGMRVVRVLRQGARYKIIGFAELPPEQMHESEQGEAFGA